MKPEDVSAEWVEKAARAIHASQCCPLDKDSQCYGWPINMEEETARAALAAVLPDIQAQALEYLADMLQGGKKPIWAIGPAGLRDLAADLRAGTLTARLTAETKGQGEDLEVLLHRHRRLVGDMFHCACGVKINNEADHSNHLAAMIREGRGA